MYLKKKWWVFQPANVSLLNEGVYQIKGQAIFRLFLVGGMISRALGEAPREVVGEESPKVPEEKRTAGPPKQHQRIAPKFVSTTTWRMGSQVS